MDDHDDATFEILCTAQVGTFWELRAARLKDTAEGEMAAHQADVFAGMLTTEAVLVDNEPERDLHMLS